ncbi:MAG TPA: asparagine synthase (glutamine-hydrolyzing) [Pyrinomonadaceae bacterium]
MSGIGAIYYLDSREVDLASLERINALLKHRGADSSGVCRRRCVGLTHRMMWTTPESVNERLPAKGDSGFTFVTCDARIDNRDELLSILPFNGRKPADVADSEIILAAYEKWGLDCLARLIGDFVFVIWDERERTLFAARDPLGVKHFYYHHRPGKLFALASEIKALFAIEEIPRHLDEQHLGDYLVVNSEDKESTFYKDIKRLPATHALLVSEKGLRTWRYWLPATDELKFTSDGEYQEAFREKFSTAVTSRLRSAYPVGSMLSGGLDSSSIVCVADRYLKTEKREPLHTFSAIFPEIASVDPRIDETRFMHSVIERTNCQPHFVKVDGASPLQDTEKILWHTDDPIGAPIYMDWAIFKAAKAENVRVVLSGIDGDSTVSHGYEDFANFAQRGWYLRLIKESIALSRNMPRRSHSVKRLLWHRGLARTIPAWVYSAWRTLRRRKPEDYTRSPIVFPLHLQTVNADFRRRFDLEDRIVKLQEANYPAGISPIEYHWRGLTNGHFAMILENCEKAAAAQHIEPRYPFFDRRLIEFCIALPPGQRIYKGWTRSIFRHAMEGIVPADVQWRIDKSNIGASLKINLLRYGAERLENELFGKEKRLERYLDLRLLRNAYEEYRSDPLGRDALVLLMLTSVYLSSWLKHSGFDRETPASAGSRMPLAHPVQSQLISI